MSSSNNPRSPAHYEAMTEAKIEEYRQCDIYGTACVDEEFLREKGMYDEVERIVTRAGWPGLMTWRSETDEEDVDEFLGTFSYFEKEGVIGYRHRGIWHTTHLSAIEDLFGWVRVEEEPGFDQNHANRVLWRALTDSNAKFEAGRSNMRECVFPVYWYLQKLLSHSFLGRQGGSQKASLLDMHILRGFYYERTPRYAQVFCTHLKRMQPKGPILVGGFITYILHNIHGTFDPSRRRLDFDSMTRQKVIAMKGLTVHASTKTAYWNYHPTRTLEEPPRTKKGRKPREITPPPLEEAQPREATPPPVEQVQPREDTPPQEEAQPHGPFGDDVRRFMFIEQRVLEYLAPPGADLQAGPPEDWIPGQPIPEEFQLRKRRRR